MDVVQARKVITTDESLISWGGAASPRAGWSLITPLTHVGTQTDFMCQIPLAIPEYDARYVIHQTTLIALDSGSYPWHIPVRVLYPQHIQNGERRLHGLFLRESRYRIFVELVLITHIYKVLNLDFLNFADF